MFISKGLSFCLVHSNTLAITIKALNKLQVSEMFVFKTPVASSL